MSDLSKLESMYEKEIKLVQTHKEKAEILKQRIEQEKSQAILKSVKKINLSPKEFKELQKALENEKNIKTLLQQQQIGGNAVSYGTERETKEQTL